VRGFGNAFEVEVLASVELNLSSHIRVVVYPNQCILANRAPTNSHTVYIQDDMIILCR
jgi:hypothetical protein